MKKQDIQKVKDAARKEGWYKRPEFKEAYDILTAALQSEKPTKKATKKKGK